MIPIGKVAVKVKTWNPIREAPDESFKYVDLSSVDQLTKSIVEAREVVGREAPSRARQIIATDDVLVATVRPNLNGVAKVSDSLHEATASTGFCVIRPDIESLNSNYLFHWVKTPAFVADMVRKSTGANYPAVSDRIIFDSTIPLPPLSEQKRIASILDRAEALRAKRRAALALLDELTQSIFLDMFGVGDAPSVLGTNRKVQNHNGWKYVLLTDVARLATGHTPDRERQDYWNGDIPWISLTDIRGLDGKIAENTLQSVTELGIRHSSSVKLPAGTVCFSRTASVGFITTMGREMSTSQDFVNWVPGGQIDSTYLMHALMQSRQHLKSISSGSTHKTIYVRVVEKFRALIPPIALQRQFAARVKCIETQKGDFERSFIELDQLFASLQHRAFRGEL